MTEQQAQQEYFVVKTCDCQIIGDCRIYCGYNSMCPEQLPSESENDFCVRPIQYRPHTLSTCPQHAIWKHRPHSERIRQEAAAQAREKVLEEVKKYCDTCVWVEDDCCPGKMNDKEDSDCDVCSYVDYPNNADICEKIGSLRTPTPKEAQR